MGVLGLASELVSADEKYSGLVSYLLGRVVVVDQIDHAIALAKKYRYSLRIVTLDGELLSPGGSMTGGAFKNSSNLLGRRREIEELEAACKKALEQVEAVQKELAETGRRLTEAKRTLASVQERRQQMQIQQNTLELTICQLEARRQEIADSSQDLSSENQELELQVGDLRGALRELQTEETKLETLSNEKNQYVEEQQTGLETAKKRVGKRRQPFRRYSLGIPRRSRRARLSRKICAVYCRSRNVSGQRKRNFPAVTRTAARRSLPESERLQRWKPRYRRPGTSGRRWNW